MPLWLALGITCLTGFGAALLTRAVRSHTLAHGMLDIPNQRSSHTHPTPRGGGVAIAVCTLSAVAAEALAGLVSPRFAAAFCGGGALVAWIGWVDDRRSVSARARALVHTAAAVWGVAWLGGLEQLRIGTTAVSLGHFGSIAAVIALVWLTNLYNFMDGIDGLAATEAVTTAGVGGVLLWIAHAPGLAIASSSLAAAAAGFLVWNWEPAQIFMGDVGSGLLGYLLGVLAIASERAASVPALIWAVLLLAFIGDATITLTRRAFRRLPFHQAHRSHAYQRAVQMGWRHRHVVLALVAANMALAALAAAAWWRPSMMALACLGSVTLVSALYLAVERIRPMSERRP